MIITLGGPAGSGKGTVSNILAKRFNLKQYGTGDFRRLKAKELGMTIEEYNKYGETHPETDNVADEWQKNLGITEDNFIMDARIGFHFIPHSIKIYLDVSDEEAAIRIFNAQSDKNRINQQKTLSLEEQKKLNIERRNSDILRYKKWYNIENFTAKENYDLYIDTSNIAPEVVADKVIEFIELNYSNR